MDSLLQEVKEKLVKELGHREEFRISDTMSTIMTPIVPCKKVGVLYLPEDGEAYYRNYSSGGFKQSIRNIGHELGLLPEELLPSNEVNEENRIGHKGEFEYTYYEQPKYVNDIMEKLFKARYSGKWCQWDQLGKYQALLSKSPIDDYGCYKLVLYLPRNGEAYYRDILLDGGKKHNCVDLAAALKIKIKSE